jgi:hypothetical protein
VRHDAESDFLSLHSTVEGARKALAHELMFDGPYERDEVATIIRWTTTLTRALVRLEDFEAKYPHLRDHAAHRRRLDAGRRAAEDVG